MKITLHDGAQGNGFVLSPGTVVDWKPDAEAQRLIDQGAARMATQHEIDEAGTIRTVKTRLLCQ